jgi:hypothetical protein
MTAPQPSAAPGAPADGGAGGQAPSGTHQPHNPQAPANAPGAQPQTPTGQDVSSLPDWAQKLINDTRSEAAKHRTEKQTAAQEAQAAKAQRDAILKAAGLKPDGSEAEPDPAALAAQIEQAQAIAWTSQVELNVFRTAAENGLNAAALLDSRAFIDSLDSFTEADLSSPEFGQQLAAHIKKYGEQHPQFKASPQTTAPPRAGTDRAAGSGGSPTRQPVQGLGAAIRAHYGQR